MTSTIVGGGAKKILHTLANVRRMGLRNSAKALNSKNTCKACGLGMGGQLGGMTDESGDFPSVCNKSIQAQSTDIQAPIPVEVFRHSLAEFRELSGRELEHLGRLDTPLYKPADSNHFRPMGWDEAIALAAARFATVAPARSFFYSSGRSSNEAGFVLQLLARLYGTNNVNNCSYYCHQATGVGLDNSIGTGTATVELEDLNGCDLIFVIGANPASNHPRFIYKLKNCTERGGRVVVINPAREPGLVRFALPKSAKSLIAGGSQIATDYVQPHIGSDLALLTGIAKAVLERGAEDGDFIAAHTEGFDAYRATLQSTDWDSLIAHCGVDRGEMERIAHLYANAQNAVFAWGMGITHHLDGVDKVEAIANLALLRGMLGRRHAGLLPLRGHSNVQGIGTIGVKPVLPAEVLARMEAAFNLRLPTAKGMDTLACLEAADRGEIDAALVMGGNLYEATPHSAWAAGALGKIPFKLFLTTTLNRGHVVGHDHGEALILPVTARDEEWQSTTQESMFNFVRLSDGGITRLHNVRPEVTILCDIATRLLADCPVDFTAFKSHGKIREAIAATVPGLEDLADIDVARREFHVRGRILHSPEFRTPSGRGRFIPHDLGQPAGRGEFPLTLASIRSEGQFNSIIYEEVDSYRGTKNRQSILMNRDDMARLGLNPGDRATLASAHGEMPDVEVQPFDLPPGNVLAYYPEANVLIGTGRDPRSHTPAFKSVPVRVVP
ncbi:MAG: FdhF/YdeP family oxidoreductase [Porticoccaceae bacterium]|jgi:molybdopterin-dependent oxidoreductase alpha subunit|nr:FdhF/YdeP family oxidoreductase [Porticoccaceae bacterium]HLS98872.1 FdhF/YdeP family oxidoreductase [Porticoccaceae bacterium]